MYIKVTKVTTSQGLNDYYLTDIQTTYLVDNPGASIVSQITANISSDMVTLLLNSSDTNNSFASNVYYFAENISQDTNKSALLQQLNTLSNSYPPS